ncbi:hypothetical protein BUALT_Bualt11G0060700 [Buddleja alternifolia]|uniref:Transmembrane protein n=1 Tax=Buddleja alternifolia TaxID=168488 RepID=A0AAV6X3J5_9LAMI|nr:hypothetical protein BUALT_Bualt11G0060700 [Buddleja alternifolia]
MARPLQSLSMQNLHFLPPQFTFLIILTAVFSVFSVVTFLCGSHKGVVKSLRGKDESKTVRLGGGKNKGVLIEKMKSRLSSKALLMAKMISWRKVEDEEAKAEEEYCYEDEGENGAVWRKTIIKGEKCRPIDFSGKIMYDCNGNLLPD